MSDPCRRVASAFSPVNPLWLRLCVLFLLPSAPVFGQAPMPAGSLAYPEGVRHVVHQRDPFVASLAADKKAIIRARSQPGLVTFFAPREVLNPDGSFPFGEGALYELEPKERSPSFVIGAGRAGAMSLASHIGRKAEQQDAIDGRHFVVGDQVLTVIAAADGVSAAGALARPAAQRAVATFMREIEDALRALPVDTFKGSPASFEENAQRLDNVLESNLENILANILANILEMAAAKASLAVVQQVTLRKDEHDEHDAREEHQERDQSHEKLDALLRSRLQGGEAIAQTTFVAALIVGSDVYVFSCGDSVLALFRPRRPAGVRFVHLTHRDQVVVKLYTNARQGSDTWKSSTVYQNMITNYFGHSARLSGTLRRYQGLLQKGDRLLVATDGLSPRAGGGGLDRKKFEDVLLHNGRAQDLVDAQLADLAPGTYQDNMGVVVLEIE